MTGIRVTSGPGRFVWARLVALAVIVFAAGCTPTYSTTADTTTTLLPPPRSVLRVGVERWPTCLNPLLCDDDALTRQILQQVLPGAYRLDDDNDYVATGLLAEPAEVTVSDGDDDGPAMTIRYRISADARWADGKPITSSDFVGTWRAVMSTPGADKRGYELISAVDDRDPLVAVVRLSERYADWRELFGGATNHLLQADAFGATTDLTGLYADGLPFAAGPYQLVSWSENEAVLSRVDNDWDPARTAGIDQVRLRPVTLAEVSPDSFDVLVPATPAAQPPAGYSVLQAPTTRVVGVWFDQRSLAMQLPEVRRFLSQGLDADALADAAADVVPVAGRVECIGWVPGVGPWCDAAPVSFTHDPRAALDVLVALGWTADPEGRLVNDAGPLTMTLTWDPSDTAAGAVAAEVAADLTSFGVTVEVASMPTSRFAANRPLDDSVGIGVYTVDLGVGPTPTIYDCAAGVESSVLAWCPAANADTVAALGATIAVDERVELVATLGRRARSAMAWIPLVQRAETFYVRTERVDVPDLTRAVGGPLAHLAEFTVVD